MDRRKLLVLAVGLSLAGCAGPKLWFAGAIARQDRCGFG